MAKKYARQSSPNKNSNLIERPSTLSETRSRISEFNPDYTYIARDIRRIGILAASLLGGLIVLAFFLN
jgi:hypothetical protein